MSCHDILFYLDSYDHFGSYDHFLTLPDPGIELINARKSDMH